jgi:hypothetical protein
MPVIGTLQSDLQAALTGARPSRSWGFLQFANGLATAVLHVRFRLLLTTRVRCEPRIILPAVLPGEAFAPAPAKITPATLSTRAAYGVLAIAAATLRSLGRGRDHHVWNPDSGKCELNIASFLAWLPADVRRRLQSW